MSNSFSQFKQQIDQALSLLENASAIQGQQLPDLHGKPFIDTPSLLARCEQVCEKHKEEKPTIRIIHHLACSGGTLISKCIAAMPNVYLLSEVHPLTDLGTLGNKPAYAPSDITKLAKYAGIPKHKELAAKIFKKSIDETYQHITQMGGILVIRDHTHADFCTDAKIPHKSTIIELLEDSYNITSILTIRNPLDSFSSLVKNGWVHFKPESFDEYCRRLLLLTKQFNPEQIINYEDFLNTPLEKMQSITKLLDLPFDDMFVDVFSVFKVTGDSGRTSDVIGERSSLVPDSIILEAEKSKFYHQFLKNKH